MAKKESAASLLRELRLRQGRSLRTVAEATGMTASQLSRIETGQRGLSDETEPTLARYYGVDPLLLAISAGRLPRAIQVALLENPAEIRRLSELYEAAQGDV